MEIEQHYSNNLNRDALLQELRKHYPEGPDCYQLAPVDQLHIGGIKASQKLIKGLKQHNPQQILEIGSGLGGLMRLIQQSLPDVRVTGIDITHEFNLLNRDLSQIAATSLNSEQLRVLTGDAQQLPFADNSFDCIIFQHSLLNIPDSHRCLSECRRVLKSGGTLFLHEVLKGQNHAAMVYPVPWAQHPDQSHLQTIQQLSERLEQGSFVIDSLTNWSDEALIWRQRQTTKEQPAEKNSLKSKPVISPVDVLGKTFRQMGPNVMKNLHTEAVEVWEITAS